MSFPDNTLICLEGNWLKMNFDQPHFVLSWAIIGGGVGSRNAVVWHEIQDTELSADLDPVLFFQNRMIQNGIGKNTVGFLTSASLKDFTEITLIRNNYGVRCIATVGLNNAVCVASAKQDNQIHGNSLKQFRIGTINLLIQVSQNLSFHASLEATSIATEARTLAVLEAKLHTRDGKNFVTGTGTDCIAVASQAGKRESAKIYAGKHTELGQLIGEAVYSAVTRGIQKWKEHSYVLKACLLDSSCRS